MPRHSGPVHEPSAAGLGTPRTSLASARNQRSLTSGFRRYEGDGPDPDLAFVHAVVAEWTATGRSASAYGMDFGVVDGGDTVFLELNDGFALGSYGLADDLYTNLVMTRWHELVSASGVLENMAFGRR